METLFFAPSMLLGFSAQKQELQVDYFSQFETNPHTPGEVLTIEIQSRHIQVKEATMEIVAELRGELSAEYFLFLDYLSSLNPRFEIHHASPSLDLCLCWGWLQLGHVGDDHPRVLDQVLDRRLQHQAHYKDGGNCGN